MARVPHKQGRLRVKPALKLCGFPLLVFCVFAALIIPFPRPKVVESFVEVCLYLQGLANFAATQAGEKLPSREPRTLSHDPEILRV